MEIYEQCKSEAEQSHNLKVDNVLNSLDKKDAESLRKALLDSSIATRAIARVLEANNISCGLWAINQWRRTNNVELKTSHSFEGKK